MGELPEANVLVHSGDFTMTGSESEAIDFMNWFCDLPHKHKIFICGNHDECLYGANIDGLDNNVPQAHLFGHIHKSHGVERIGTTIYSNAAIMNEDYTNLKLPNLINI